YRHGNQLLHVGGGQADARRLNQHPRRGELGEHVHVHVRQDPDAQRDHACRRRDDQVAEPQAGADDKAHQGRWHGRVRPGCAVPGRAGAGAAGLARAGTGIAGLARAGTGAAVLAGAAGVAGAHSSPLMSYSVPSSSGAPTVTTAAPAVGPALSIAALPRISPTVIRWRMKVRGAVFTNAQVEPSLS